MVIENSIPLKKPICAVLDTNVWRREHLLNSAVGAAFIYRLSKVGGCIGLPEVIELEVITQIVQLGRKAVDTINSNLATIRALVGKTDEVRLPSESEFENAVKARLAELDDLLVKLNISREHYDSALKRVIQKTPPNASSEQFRDSLTWEAALELAATYDVAFITDDSDFRQSNKHGGDLANDLISECVSKGVTVKLYPDLASFLHSYKDDALSLDYERISALLRDELISKHLGDLIGRQGFRLGDLKESSIDAFVTERRGVLALEFKLVYRAFDVLERQAIINDPETEAKLIELDTPVTHPEANFKVTGGCFFEESNDAITDIRLGESGATTLDGRDIVGIGSIYASGHIVLGRKSIPHKTRRRLDEI
jgi:hypothetical protein